MGVHVNIMNADLYSIWRSKRYWIMQFFDMYSANCKPFTFVYEYSTCLLAM